MRFLFNNGLLKDRRRELRIRQTESERLVWSRVRGRQVKGLKFCRQYSIGPYILDFYCPEVRLGIELDGSQHLEPEHKEYDRQRTEFLKEHGIRIIRFWNNDVMRNIEAVMQTINDSVLPP